MVNLKPTIPSLIVKEVLITTDQNTKNANANIVVGVAGKMGYWNHFVNFFTSLENKKIEVHPEQGQSILVRIGDLSKALNITSSTLYNLSQQDKEIDSLIKKNNALIGIHNIEHYKNAKSDLFIAFRLLALSPTFKAEDLTKLIKDERMMDPKMQGAVIKAAKIVRKNEQNPSPKPQEIYVSKELDSYGFIVDKENKVYIRTKEIGKGTFKRVKGALQLQKLKKRANITIKDKVIIKSEGTTKIEAKGEVEAEQAALKLLQGCRHIVKPSKFVLVTKTKKLEPKYVLMQKRLAGDGFKLLDSTPKQQLNAFRDFAEGLGDIHERGLIHSDVKLANFLIGDEGEGYVHDFGFLTTPQKVKGSTPAYEPPEEDSNFSSKFDSYGLGVSMLQVILGKTLKDANEVLRLINIYKDNSTKMEDYFKFAKNIVTSSTPNEEDRAIKLKMLAVAEKLLHHDPGQRISCKKAAKLLAA